MSALYLAVGLWDTSLMASMRKELMKREDVEELVEKLIHKITHRNKGNRTAKQIRIFAVDLGLLTPKQ
jgi:hypothetical protein